MIVIKKVASLDSLSECKNAYLEQTSAALDGMWLTGFAEQADHFAFYIRDQLVGFFCLNSDGYLLQFYLKPECYDQASSLFSRIVRNSDGLAEKVRGAFVSTAEPHYLSLCLDCYTGFEVNALMYQLQLGVDTPVSAKIIAPMAIVTIEQLAELIAFAQTNVGAPEQWLRPYYSNLIHRRELFGLWRDGRLVAAGECRGYDKYQVDYADLGIIVDRSVRGQGLASAALSQLVVTARARGLIPICSTEKDNVAAQKAIARAGFIANHRIVQFTG